MEISQVHVRVLFLLGAVGVLFMLRTPLNYPDKPGSKGFIVTVLALSLWLGSSGLSIFFPGLRQTLVLYNFLLFAILLAFIGWVLIAIEFATRKFPSRRILLVLGTLAAVQFSLLWTNFFGFHELMYTSATTVENAALDPSRGPLFWVHAVVSYGLLFFATVLLVAEWVNATGLRRRQAGVLATTPVFGATANVLWLMDVVDLTFDPTPIGVTIGVVILGWALYRAEFLEVAPVARDTVVEQMTDAVVIIDDDDRVVDWNSTAVELFGTTEPTVGMSAGEFFAPIPDETLATFAETTQTETEISFELDGRQRHFSVLLSPIDAERAETLGRIVVVRDITAIKRREKQLVKQNEYLDEFAGIVSHDLQSPLMQIRGNADAAVNSGDVSHVEYVLDATDRMEQLIDDLLELARTGQQIEETESVALDTVAQQVWSGIWATNAELVVEADVTIAADPDRLQQLLENLFRNAVEHGTEHPVGGDDPPTALSTGGTDEPSDPAVSITVGSLPGGFYVEDDGQGIPSEERYRVFERGYSSSDDGTGLGLGIVKQIAGAHGWSVRATEGSAGGARFEITGVEPQNSDC